MIPFYKTYLTQSPYFQPRQINKKIMSLIVWSAESGHGPERLLVIALAIEPSRPIIRQNGA
jgi:hypothetical protein